MVFAKHGQRATWRIHIISGFVFVIALFCAAWLWLLLGQFTTANYQQATKATEELAQSISIAVEDYTGDNVGALLARCVSGQDHRVMLLDKNRLVIADTGAGTLEHDNAEISSAFDEAVRSGTSASLEQSSVDGVERIFVVDACMHLGKQVYVQVSTDARTFNDTLVSNQAIGLGLLLTCLLLASIISYIAFRSASNGVNMMEIAQAKFVANASHELKTPIAGIKLLSETIIRSIDKNKPERIRECAEKIDDESDHLERIVSSLIDVARAQSNPQTKPHARSTGYHIVDARKAARASFESHRILAAKKKLDYTYDEDLPENVAVTIRVPAASSTAIADNLIENAIHYTSAGFVRVRLSADDQNVIFSVSDSGVGMTPREQEMVFERYYRSHRSQSMNSAGSGIGLALVRDAVKASNGTVTLESEPGKGSTFTVRLPIIAEENADGQ